MSTEPVALVPTVPPWEDGEAPAIQTSKNKTSSWDDYRAHIPNLVAHMKWLDTKLNERRQWLRNWAWPRYYHDARRFDMRTEAERRSGSRPFFLDPQAFATIQSIATSCTADVLSVSPPFISRGRGVEDTQETQIERLITYDLSELNPASAWVEEAIERACVQGMTILSARHVVEATKLRVEPRDWDQHLFNEAVAAAAEMAPQAGPPPEEPAEFAQWRAEVARMAGIRVPAPPAVRDLMVHRRAGPVLRHEELDQITWDPSEPTLEYQRRIYKRGLVLRSVLLAEAKRRPDLWDEDAIKNCPATSNAGDTAGQTGVQIHAEYLRSLKVKADFAEDPYYKDAILVYQTFAPLDDGIKYAAIGNESVPLTKQPEQYLYQVPMLPFFSMQNVRTPGASIGISEYEPAASVYEHLDAVQSQKLYWMMLQLFQPFVVPTEAAAQKLMNIEPGKPIVADDELDRYKLLFTAENGRSILNEQPVIADAALAGMRALTDLASGVYGPGRGEPAPMNRVTGAEFAGRQQGADVRRRSRLWKLGAMSCQHMIPFCLALRYQFSEPSHVANIAGGDPFQMLSSENLLEAIQENYVLTAAVIDPNAPLTIQQLREAVKMAGEMGLLKPGGKAPVVLFTQQLQALRTQGATEIGRLVAQDAAEAKKEEDAVGQLTQQLEQMKADMDAMQQQNDALRRAVLPAIPPAKALDAELRVIEAQAQQGAPPQGEAPPPEAGGPPPMPPGEEPMA